MGRVRGFPVAREGAQKFKEITYRHAEAYPTSELKHGPLALISAAVPTVAVVPDDELTDRNVAALHEAGVPLFAGTDAGSVLPHGLVVDELHELVAAGLSRTAALDAATWSARRWLGLLPLGAGIAGGLGLPLRKARLALILLAGVATGAATVFVGPLSFVGLMAPHLSRRLGLAQPGDHVTGAALIGAGLMLAADFGARMAGFPYDLPLGLFASLIGAPWLIWLMMRSGR